MASKATMGRSVQDDSGETQETENANFGNCITYVSLS